jgi:uridine kinase
LVAIVGGSGSGKSRLAEELQAALEKSAGRLSLDDFYRDRSHLSAARRARINFDNPAAIDWPAFERVLDRCLNWKDAQVPDYDFTTHCRRRCSKVLKPRPIMLVEGLWLLRSPRIRRLFGFSIFLDCSVRLRLQRRLARDVTGRGRSRKSIREQFWRTVQPMHLKFVSPQARRANSVFKSRWGAREVTKLAAILRQKAERLEVP